MTKRKIICGVALAVLAGCSAYQPPAPTLTVPYNDAEAAMCDGVGTGKITGQAFFRQVGGGTVFAAGEQVTLLANTAYADELLGLIASEGTPVNLDPRLRSHARITQADGFGNFEFSGLPPCNYIVSTQAYWSTGGAYDPWQGGILAAAVPLANGEAKRVVLTR